MSSPVAPDVEPPKIAPDVEKGKNDDDHGFHRGKTIISFADARSLTLALPLTTYSMAAVFPAIFPFDEDKLRWIRILIIAVGQYWLSLAISVIYIVYIKDLWSEEEVKLKAGACIKTDTVLMYTSLFVFTVAILVDIRETVETARFIRLLPHAEGLMSNLHFTEENGKAGFGTDGGMTSLQKICVYVFVLVPKLLLAGFLLILGSWWILQSTSNTFVFLHTMSLTFVLRLDNLVYDLFNSREHQNLMKKIPAIKLLRPTKIQWFIARYAFFIELLVVPIVVCGILLQAESMPDCAAK